jgi:hypothetical protein
MTAGGTSPVDEREELNMSNAGLSKSRLERMQQVLSGYVARKAPNNCGPNIGSPSWGWYFS